MQRTIEFYRGSDRQWFWRVRAKNGRSIAVGGEGYVERREVIKAALRALDLALPLRVNGEGPDRFREPVTVIQPRGARAKVAVYYGKGGRIIYAQWLFENGFFYQLEEVEGQ